MITSLSKQTKTIVSLGFTFFFSFTVQYSVTAQTVDTVQQEVAEQQQASLDDEWSDSFDDEWLEQPESPWQLTGFSEYAIGGFTQQKTLNTDLSLNELRIQQEVNYSSDDFVFSGTGFVIYDDVLSSVDAQFRELQLSFSATSDIDFNLGRQIITWGTGDYLFLNDLFAKDWQSFFSGRHDDYLKAPNDAIRVTSYFDQWSVDVVFIPEFTANDFLIGERFSFYSPQTGRNIAPENKLMVSETNQSQYALRLARQYGSSDVAFYAYKGFWNDPVGIHTDTSKGIFFPKLSIVGASVITPVGKGIFNMEAAFYNSGTYQDNQQGIVPENQVRFLMGYLQEVAKNLTASLQYYLEHNSHYRSASLTANSQNRHLVTARFTYTSFQQKLNSSLFIFYSPTDNDGYFRPSISYRVNDTFQYSFGGNVFWGRNNHTFFGQHQENTNLWLRMRINY